MKVIPFILLLSLVFSSCQEEQDAKQTAVTQKMEMLTSISPEKKSKDSTITNSTIMPKPNPSFDKDYIMGKFNPTKHKDFVVIANTHSSRAGMYLRKDAYKAFKEMYEAAKADGINFKIISATRNFASQKSIWEGKWTGTRLLEGGQNAAKTIPDPQTRALKILEYSSMPGTSRHHWGTDIDINNLTNAYFEKGKGLKEYTWLQANAPSFGFCQSYTPKGEERPYGYEEEKWHWSYLPIARLLTTEAKRVLKNENIEGFLGSETATGIGVLEKYVLGINKECL